MPEPSAFDYAVIRVVPRVERGEFLNVGLVLHSRSLRFLAAKVAIDPERLRAAFPWADLDAITAHLDAIPKVCAGGKNAGPIGQLGQPERFHWLVAPRSTVIQTSPVHSGLCDDPSKALEDLFDRLVAPPRR